MHNRFTRVKNHLGLGSSRKDLNYFGRYVDFWQLEVGDNILNWSMAVIWNKDSIRNIYYCHLESPYFTGAQGLWRKKRAEKNGDIIIIN